MSTTKIQGKNKQASPGMRSVLTGGTRWVLERYALVVVFAAIVALFSILKPDTFATTQNASTIASTQAVVALLALAATVPLIVGQFDVSIGFQLGLSQALCAGLQINGGLPASLAALIAIGACMAVGLINGLAVTQFRLPSFIATLGIGTFVLGLTQAYTHDEIISGTLPTSFSNLGQNSVLGIPLPFLYVAVAAVVLWVGLEYTPWGRSCYATGGAPRAAQLAGVRTTRATMTAFLLASALSGISGVLSVMILGASSPTVGLGQLLPAFAAAFLGATAVRPGRFNSFGTIIAVYMLAAGITGLQMIGAAFYVEQLFDGGALVIALSLAALVDRRSSRAAQGV